MKNPTKLAALDLVASVDQRQTGYLLYLCVVLVAAATIPLRIRNHRFRGL